MFNNKLEYLLVGMAVILFFIVRQFVTRPIVSRWKRQQHLFQGKSARSRAGGGLCHSQLAVGALMEFQDVVRKRRMVRSFESKPLPPEVVNRLLANAQKAPSAGFSQGWAFLVLESPEQTQRFWDTVGPNDAPGFRWQDLYNAPLLIVCLSNKKDYLDRYAEPDKGWTDRSEAHWSAPYWDIDTGMAAMLILLTAVDAGLGALFFGIPAEKIDRFREAFGVPPELHPIGTVAVGHAKPNDPPSPSLKRGHRPTAEIVRRGRW